MTAFATRHDQTLRRWTISAAIVVLVHGAIAAAILTWRNIIVPAQGTGPVVVDLAPAPVAPPVQQATLPAPTKPLGNVEQKAEDKTASQGEEKTAPSQFEAPQVTPPVTLAPSESTDQQEGGQTRAATGGARPGAAPSKQSEVNPLDTRIGEPPHLGFKNPKKPNDWKKAIMGRAPKSFGGRHAGRGQGGPSDGAARWARNSIGMLTPDSAGGAKASNGDNAVKNALGISTASGDNGITRSATNALGITVPIRTRLPRTSVGQHGSAGIVASHSITTPGAVINGTGMIRTNSGAAAIGGPAKTAPGGINGTTIRAR